MFDPNAFVTQIPFPQLARIAVAGDGELELPDDPVLHNHIGTVHAGALFTLGESASGVAVMTALDAALAGAMVVAKSATIAYKRPAHGRAHARGALVEPAAHILERLARDGKATFDVGVSIHDDQDVEVATMTVAWYARRAAA